MSLRHEARPSVTDTNNNELQTAHDSPAKQKSRRGLLIGAGTVASLAAAGGLWLGLGNKGSANPNTPPRASDASAPASTAPAETTPPTAATSGEGIPLPPELQPESLINLTPAEIEARFQIRADQVKTPEEFVVAYMQRIEAFDRAGCTKEEWQPYENAGKGVFEDAMLKKYAEPVMKGLYGYIASIHNKTAALNRCNVMTGLGYTYVTNIAMVPGTLSSEVVGPESFNVTFDYLATDNYSKVKEVFGDKDGTDSDNTTWRITFTNVRPVAGVLYAESINESVVSQ